MKLFSEKNEKNTNTTTARTSGARKAPPPKPQTGAIKKKGAAPHATSPKKAVIITAAVLAVFCLTFLGLGAYANGLDGFYPNVTLEGVELGGMSQEEAANRLSASSIGTFEDKELVVSLPADCELRLSGKEAGGIMSASDAGNFAYEQLHSKGFFGNTISYIKCVFGGIDLKVSQLGELNDDYIRRQTKEAAKQVSLALMDSEVNIGDDEITIIKGASTTILDEEKLFEAVKTAIEEGNFQPFKYEGQTQGSQETELDIQKLYDSIFQEPENAKYNAEAKTAAPHKDGRSFDMEQAKANWNNAQNGEKVVIPLIKTSPEITTEILNSRLFSEVLAQKSTSLSGSSSARINNITKAAAAINGFIMNPGDEFSYNEVVGQRTAAAGYQAAGAYSGGKVVSEIGGGICQVSSTLYYCALYSNLEITARSCHYFGVSYLPAGLDATVSWPAPAFKFKNNGEYPLKIVAGIDRATNSLSLQILGSNPEGIRVEMSVDSWKTSDGYACQSYRSVFDKNGKLISKTKESASTYHYEVKETPAPSPSVSPSPSPSTSPEVPPVTPPVTAPPVTPPVTAPPVTPPPVETLPPVVTPPVVVPPPVV